MADRYAFQSPFSRGAGGDPWFTLGSVAVTTTVAVTGLGVLGILLVVAEGGIGTVSQALILRNSALTGGQLWRLVTWFIPPDSDFFWALLGLLFFYMIGTQFEGMLGRKPYAALLGALILITGFLGVVAGTIVGTEAFEFGLSLPFLGLAAGFAAAMPQARSFFGIPFWVLVAFIFVVRLLGILASRGLPDLVMLLASGAIGLIGTRSLGFAPSVEWIPTVPVPAFVTGESAPRRQSAPKRRRARNKSNHLQAVPPPTNAASDAEIDALLDQVSEQGLESLTKEQKRRLEQHSKDMRKRRES